MVLIAFHETYVLYTFLKNHALRYFLNPKGPKSAGKINMKTKMKPFLMSMLNHLSFGHFLPFL